MNIPPLLVLDLESYMDGQFSLRKLTIPEYVCDPRYHDHGLAILHPDQREEFRADVSQALSELQKTHGERLEQALVVMHNGYFDYAVLNWRYGLHITNIFDTMLGAYHLFGRQGEGGEAASLEALAKKFQLTAKGDISFMVGVWTPDLITLERLREYALNDVHITRQVAERMLPQISNPRTELPTIAHTVRLFVERSLLVDVKKLLEAERLVRDQLNKGMEALGVTENDLSGNKSFVKLLSQALARTGRAIPMKEGKKSRIPAIAKNDSEMLQLLGDEDPLVQRLAEVRLQKRSSDQLLSRIERLRETARARSGKVSFQIIYHGARTGRFAGGGGFNVQNIPVAKRAKTPEGREVAKALRQAIRAEAGMKLVAVDAAQIEARVLAWMADQSDLLEQFGDPKTNVYCSFGSACLGREVRKSTGTDSPEEKAELDAFYNLSKCAVLGLGYGMGVAKFISTLKLDPRLTLLFERGNLTDQVCADIVYGYRDRYQQIASLWTEYEEAFKAAIGGVTVTVGRVEFHNESDTVCICLPSRRLLRYPQARLELSDREIGFINRVGLEDTFSSSGPTIVYLKDTHIYGGKITENVVQAVARDILVEAILCLERAGWPVVLHIHDEVILQVSSDQAEACREAAIRALSTPPSWASGLLLAAEGTIGDTLAM